MSVERHTYEVTGRSLAPRPDRRLIAAQNCPVADGAGRSAASSAVRGRPLARVLRRTVTGAWNDDIFSESASAAFWQTLSLPPLLLGLFGVLGWVGDWFGPDTVTAVQDWIVATTGNVFSRNAVDDIIAPTVRDILTTARGEVISVGFVLSLWSGSSAMAAFVDAIGRAHGQYGLRNFVWQRVIAILLYTVALVFVIVGLPLVAVGPDRLLGLVPEAFEPATEALIAGLTTPAVGVVMVIALTTLYKIAVPYRSPWWRGLPGALLAAVVFVVAVAGLRAYLEWVTSTGYTYGALAAPIAFLLGTYFIAMAIVIGAYLNAAIQMEWPATLRRRGRVVARQIPVVAPIGAPPRLPSPAARPTDEFPAGEGPQDDDHAPPDMAADRVR